MPSTPIATRRTAATQPTILAKGTMTRRVQLVIVPLPYHNKNSDRAESSKAHERKHGPDNTISDRPQQRTSLN